MSVLVDANLLLYAYDPDSPHHSGRAAGLKPKSLPADRFASPFRRHPTRQSARLATDKQV